MESYIHKLNIVRFQILLERETDAEKREIIAGLLAEAMADLARAQGGEVSEYARETPVSP